VKTSQTADEAAGCHVACSVVACEDQGSDDYEQPVAAEQFHDRHSGLLFGCSDFLEDG
jgi:hypothetical protein